MAEKEVKDKKPAATAAAPKAEKATAAKPAIPKEAAPKAEVKAPKAAPAPKAEKAPAKTAAKPAAAEKKTAPKTGAAGKTALKVTLVKSTNGCLKNQIATVAALGLRKIRQEKIHPDNPAMRGMIFKVRHLVKVEEITL